MPAVKIKGPQEAPSEIYNLVLLGVLLFGSLICLLAHLLAETWGSEDPSDFLRSECEAFNLSWEGSVVAKVPLQRGHSCMLPLPESPHHESSC